MWMYLYYFSLHVEKESNDCEKITSIVSLNDIFTKKDRLREKINTKF